VVQLLGFRWLAQNVEVSKLYGPEGELVIVRVDEFLESLDGSWEVFEA
jgi:hypothetical protein